MDGSRVFRRIQILFKDINVALQIKQHGQQPNAHYYPLVLKEWNEISLEQKGESYFAEQFRKITHYFAEQFCQIANYFAEQPVLRKHILYLKVFSFA